MPDLLAEFDSYWSLPIRGLRVLQITLDFAFSMSIGDNCDYFVRIESKFQLEDSEGVTEYTPERLSEIGPALRLFNAEIVDAKAFKNGRLTMKFSTDMTLRVEPDPRFEAWEVLQEALIRCVSSLCLVVNWQSGSVPDPPYENGRVALLACQQWISERPIPRPKRQRRESWSSAAACNRELMPGISCQGCVPWPGMRASTLLIKSIA